MRLPLLFALLFVLLGLPFLSQTGMHMDASMELACWYPCSVPAWYSDVGSHQLPWMVMTYLGAVKAWFYGPLLAWLPANVWTLRLPLLLLASSSVALFFLLLDRIWGRRAATAGAALLATDASFVLASSIDFGPVVGLHFLWLTGLLLLLHYERTSKLRLLALAFFCMGLGLWHKALFLWMLGGLGVAGLVAFPRRIWKQVTLRRLGVAAAALMAGCLPLLLYNVIFPLRTFRIADVAGTESPISHKLLILQRTLDGSVLLGFLSEEAWPETWKPPGSLPAKASFAVARSVGLLPSNTVPWFVGLAALLTPWLLFTTSRQAVLFCWVYLIVVWAQMALVGKTGGSLHHVLLLWPVPQMLLVLAGRELARRWPPGIWVGVGALATIVTGNLLLLNQYFADLTTKGTGVVFTDAVEPLRRHLESGLEQELITVDWGYHSTLCLQSKGRLPLTSIDFADSQQLEHWVRQPATLFIAHSPQAEQITGVHHRLRAAADRIGYQPQVTDVIADRNGRPRFELWRFYPNHPVDLRSELRMGDPQIHSLLRGFWEIEEGRWRWTSRRFAARLAAPKEPASLELEFHLPEVIVRRLGPLTLSARAGSQRLGARRLSEPGDHTLRWPLSAPPNGGVLDVAFELDKALPPFENETRELGIIVRAIRVKPF